MCSTVDPILGQIESETYHMTHHLSAGEDSGEEGQKVAGKSLLGDAKHSHLGSHLGFEEACNKFSVSEGVRSC